MSAMTLRDRCLALAADCTPNNVTVSYRRSLTGTAWPDAMSVPRPVTRKALYIYLHECAHIHLDHFHSRKPVHVQEMEAEQWAHRKMREASIPVPRSMTRRAKQYVEGKILQALWAGAKKIDPTAARYANFPLKGLRYGRH